MVFSTEKKPAPKAPKRKGASFRESAVTILTPGCHFNGKLFCKGSSRIGGRIEGEIVSEGLLIIEEEAEISAQIKAEEAIIQGSVSGSIEATERVELTASSRFAGDIKTASLVIQEGACFNGSSVMATRPAAEDHEFKVVEKIRKKEGASAIPDVGIK